MAKGDNFGWIKSGFFRSRSAARARNTLGIIQLDRGPKNVYRSEYLATLDAYYDSEQYDHLGPWDMQEDNAGDHIPVRKRKPRIVLAIAKMLAERVTAKLIGKSVFPTFQIEDSPDDQEFLRVLMEVTHFRSHMVEPFRRMLATGSCFVRFHITSGNVKIRWYSSKYCYPVFDPAGNLESIVIKYVYTDKNDLDSHGNPKRKWYKLELTTAADILYDNPEYEENVEPEFNVVEKADHNLGFVQGEWMAPYNDCGESTSPDGYGFTSDIMDFIDELCYNFSQSSQAVGYNQDPQLALTGMDETEIATLIRSSAKSWNFGRQGKGEFLESNLTGVERAESLRNNIRQNIQDITRILLLDPEKIVGSAQSAKAMEVLYGPLKDMIDELREPSEKILKSLITKIAIAVLIVNERGEEIPVAIPVGYEPKSLDSKLKWPPIFQQTMEDLQKKVGVAASAKNGRLIAPATATKFIAEDFGIEDVEAELKAIDAAMAAEAALNPFGGF